MSITYLRKAKDFGEVLDSPYYKEHFVKRYINNIPLMALELFNTKLTYQQIEVLNAFDWEGGRVVVPSGHGCHGINTPIMMSDGSIKKVQDVKVGDYLTGDDGGSKREVLSLSRGQEEMYEFTTTDGTKNIYNKSHKLCLVCTQTKGVATAGDKIIVTVKEWLEWSHEKKRVHTFYKVGTTFPHKELPIDPYLLGVWLGDGHSRSATITNIDEEVIDYLYNYGKQNGYDITKYEHPNKTPSYNIHRKGKNKKKTPLTLAMMELNILDNKHIPLIYKTASLAQRLEVLAGLIDTDGSLDPRGKRVFEITQKNKRLSDDILYLARSCGLHATIKEVKKSCMYKGIKKEGLYQRINITRNVEKIPTRIKRKQADTTGNKQRPNLHFRVKEVKALGVGDYYGFTVDKNHLFLDGNFIVQSNTGKTKMIGIIATAFLLLFKQSITRIQAPKSEQVTKFSFKEISASLEAIWTPRKVNGRTVVSKWAFLKKFIQVNTGSIYIKKFQKSWYIEPATAPKGDPTNLSGQHNWAYLLIFDEMSGIPDSHVQGSLGALSEKMNCCIGFSQHTNTTSMFHNFVTTQSEDMGGVWRVIRLNSEQSPRVTKQSIISWRATYTENEYNVRVLGLPPLYEDGFLINSKEALTIYSKQGKEWLNELNFDTLTVSSDVAYRGLRDSGSTVELEISAQKDVLGRTILFIILKDIDVFQGKTAKLPTKLATHAFNKMLKTIKKSEGKYKKLKQAIDATAGGHEAYTNLREMVEDSGLENVSVTGVTWGSKRMSGMEKRRFFNQRAKAYVLLQEAILEGRFYVATNKYKTRLLNELTHIPFSFTADLKYKMLSKEEMKKLNINSPDVVDAIAQQFIVHYDISTDDEDSFIETDVDEFDDIDMSDLEEDEDVDDEFEFDDTLLGETIV